MDAANRGNPYDAAARPGLLDGRVIHGRPTRAPPLNLRLALTRHRGDTDNEVTDTGRHTGLSMAEGDIANITLNVEVEASVAAYSHEVDAPS